MCGKERGGNEHVSMMVTVVVPAHLKMQTCNPYVSKHLTRIPSHPCSYSHIRISFHFVSFRFYSLFKNAEHVLLVDTYFRRFILFFFSCSRGGLMWARKLENANTNAREQFHLQFVLLVRFSFVLLVIFISFSILNRKMTKKGKTTTSNHI